MATITRTEIEAADLILDAIQQRLGGKKLLCPVTGDSEWALESYMGALPSVDTFHVAPWSGSNPRVFPYAVLVCPTCGYSMFFNLISLGLAEYFGLVADEE